MPFATRLAIWAGVKYVRTFALYGAVGGFLWGCSSSIPHRRSAVDEALAGPIHVYVWRETPDGHEPVPGVRVFAVNDEGKVTVSVFSDRSGEVELANNLDVATMKYLFAEVEGFYLTGLPWQHGSREYDLPLHIRMLIDRVTVPAPPK